MAQNLQAKQYADDMQVLAQSFSCCPDAEAEPWSADLDSLIKDPERLSESLRRGNEIFVFDFGANPFVGYGILGKHKWTILDQKTAISFIPAMAIDYRFRGKGFGTAILDYLIKRSLGQHSDTHWIGLYVHEDNFAAQRLYTKFGFQFLEEKVHSHRKMIAEKP